MSNDYSWGDAVHWFHTGSNGSVFQQPDPALSLGNYRADDEVLQVSLDTLYGIRGVRVEYVSGNTPSGDHPVDTSDPGKLRFKVSGGTYGPSVALPGTPIGFRGVLRDGTDASRFVRVHWYGSNTDLHGVQMSRIGKRYNNAVGMSDISDTERLAGEIKVRCLGAACAANGVTDQYIWINPLGSAVTTDVTQLGASGTGTIKTTGSLSSFRDFGYGHIFTAAGASREIVYYVKHTTAKELHVESASWRGLLGTSASAGVSDDVIYPVPGVKIAWEAASFGPGGDAYYSVAATENDTSAISGFTWSTGITKATGLNPDDLAANGEFGLWIWMEIPPIAANTLAFDASIPVLLKHQFVGVIT